MTLPTEADALAIALSKSSLETDAAIAEALSSDRSTRTLTKGDSALARALQMAEEEEFFEDNDKPKDFLKSKRTFFGVQHALTPPQKLHRRLSSERGPSTALQPRQISRRPSELEYEQARDVLTKRLEDYGLVEYPIIGDGACQFRALAHQLHGNQEQHPKIRERVVKQLKDQRDQYDGFIFEETYESFLGSMARSETWGDHVTLQAAADSFRVRICIITSYPVKPFIHVLPVNVDEDHGQTLRTIWLAFWAEVHYSSLAAFRENHTQVGLVTHPTLGHSFDDSFDD